MKIIPFRRQRLPYTFFNANYGLIALQLLVFFLAQLFHDLPFYLSLSGAGIVEAGFYWQFFTYTFTEVDIWSLIFNLLAFFFFGSAIEQRMGSYQFIVFYFGISFLSGLLAFIALFALVPYSVNFFGAGGMVLAFILAFASFFPDHEIYFFGIFPIRAPVLVLIIVGIQVFFFILQGVFSFLHLGAFVLSYVALLIFYRVNIFRSFFR